MGVAEDRVQEQAIVYGLIIFLATWVVVEIVQMTLMYFIKYVVQREAQSEIILSTVFVTAIFALPVWNFVAQRWSKRWAYIFGLGFWAIVQIVLIMLNAQTAFWFLLLICFLAGIGVAAAHVLPWSIIPDAIEWGELQTGERNEGMFYSLVTLIYKVATSLALLGISQVLQFTGYVANAPQQTQSALNGIRIAIGPIPAVMLGIGILFAYLYPLDRKEHAEVVAQLEQRRAEAHEETALAR
ncbi:MAG: MFS transporter [Anaerolineae bacterium]|nr:MFS transporter [Anaerolineae bacterium]